MSVLRPSAELAPSHLLWRMVPTESFEEVLEANVQLSFFVPLIVGHAGNTGSQAVSTVIRALALAEAALKDSLHITNKEFMTGGMIGLYLAAFAYPLGVKVAGIPYKVMLSVAVSLPSVSCVANLIGAGLPLICDKLKLDPAVIAAPMMTTMVDCSGILTYLMISKVIIGEQKTEEELEKLEGKIEGELEEDFHTAPCPGAGVHGAAGGGVASPPPPPFLDDHDPRNHHGQQVVVPHGGSSAAGSTGAAAGSAGEGNHTEAAAEDHSDGEALINLGMGVLLIVMILVSLKVLWSAKMQHKEDPVEGAAAPADSAAPGERVTVSVRTIAGTTKAVSVDSRPLTMAALRAAVGAAFDRLPEANQLQFALVSDPDKLLPADDPLGFDLAGLGVGEGTELLLVVTGLAPIERMLPRSTIEAAMREVIRSLAPIGGGLAAAAAASPKPSPGGSSSSSSSKPSADAGGTGTPVRRRRLSMFNLSGTAESTERGGDKGGNSSEHAGEVSAHANPLSPTTSESQPPTSVRRRRRSIFNMKGTDSAHAAGPVRACLSPATPTQH
jgi:cation transporter-like permease